MNPMKIVLVLTVLLMSTLPVYGAGETSTSSGGWSVTWFTGDITNTTVLGVGISNYINQSLKNTCDYSYCIRMSGSTVEALNGTTDQIEFSGSVPQTIVNTALNATPVNGTVIIIDQLLLTNHILVPSNRNFIVANILKMADNTQDDNMNILRNLNQSSSDTNINIIFESGGYIDGNNITQPSGKDNGFAVYFKNVTNLNLLGYVKVINQYNWGTRLENVQNFYIEDYFSESNADYQDGLHLIDSSNGIIDSVTGYVGDDILAFGAVNQSVQNITVGKLFGTSKTASGLRINQESTIGSVNVTISNIIIDNINIFSPKVNCILLGSNGNTTTYNNIRLKGICDSPNSTALQIGSSANETFDFLDIDMQIRNPNGYGYNSGQYTNIINSNIKLTIDNAASGFNNVRLMKGSNINLDLDLQYPAGKGSPQFAALLGRLNYSTITGSINGGSRCLMLGNDATTPAFNNTVRGLICINPTGYGIYEGSGGNNNQIIDNTILGTANTVFLSGANSIQRNNYGVSGYSHGVSATCTTKTAFGIGDTCTNSTTGFGYNYNGSAWVYAVQRQVEEEFTGNGVETFFNTTYIPIVVNSTKVTNSTQRVRYGSGAGKYTANSTGIIFGTAPGNGESILVDYVI